MLWKSSTHWKVMRDFSLGISLVFFGLFTQAHIASAIEYGGFGGRPAFPREDNPRTESIFVHTLYPGDIQQEGVLIVNNTNEIKTILVSGVDSTPSTDGAFACAQNAATTRNVGSWIALEKTEITLEPGTNEMIPFAITVPESASVGEHNGCIVMQEKKDNAQNGNGVSLSFRTGLRVSVTIPGEIKRSLAITGFSLNHDNEGVVTFHPEVTNEGNVSVDADVRVEARYFFGKILESFGGQYPILRGDTSNFNFELNRPFWGGWYKANLTLSYDANAEASIGIKSGKDLTVDTSQTLWFFSFPTWKGLFAELAIFIFIATGISFIVLSKKRKTWVENTWVLVTVKSGEDIQSIAKKYNISWKILAKANSLLPPYTLKARQKIRVPPEE